ncbi:hypothetical protein RJ639_021428 [Escallonia herrerae]|uniref:Uncharacterized protein n=1 Tax=Escallonia herrerae TaxID=1293975 RepID=A0AA88V5V0_9ASTE|nr:hypothetical protein RJ639_021428 [Escallonia herrerae]
MHMISKRSADIQASAATTMVKQHNFFDAEDEVEIEKEWDSQEPFVETRPKTNKHKRMEVLYLLCSIITTSLTSLTLSLLLLLRRLLPSTAAPHHPADPSVSLYQGTVWHERRRPVHHSFKYTVRYALVDLDHSSHAPHDHLSANDARLRARTSGPVFLLTIPPSVGYEQNPLSLYYCYDLEGSTHSLKRCMAEELFGNLLQAKM